MCPGENALNLTWHICMCLKSTVVSFSNSQYVYIDWLSIDKLGKITTCESSRKVYEPIWIGLAVFRGDVRLQ